MTSVPFPPAASSSFALDTPRVRQQYANAAAGYDCSNVLAREIAQRMDERLDYIRLTPRRIIDIGCGTGTDLPRLAARYPDAFVGGADFAFPMLTQAKAHTLPLTHQSRFRRLFSRQPSAPPLVCASVSALPFAPGSISLFWSNLMLPGLDDPLPAFREIHRCLEVGGLLMFSTFGPDTLKELRAVLPSHTGERVHRFIDMHDLGDVLVKAGFSDPVIDMEMLTLTYTDFSDLLADLRTSGGNNASQARPRGLMGKAGWAAARQAYEALRVEGRLPASFEIIQGHAWKAPPTKTDDGRAIIRFQAQHQSR